MTVPCFYRRFREIIKILFCIVTVTANITTIIFITIVLNHQCPIGRILCVIEAKLHIDYLYFALSQNYPLQ